MKRDEKFGVSAVMVDPPSQPKDVWGWKISPTSSGPLLQATWPSSPECGGLWLCPMGCLEPSGRGQLMTRSRFCGGIPHSWEAQKPLVSYLGPHRHTIKAFPLSHSSSSSHPGRWHLFPVTHFLSLWVEGGERGCAGSRVGGCGGGGRVKSLTLYFPPPQSLL